MSYLAFWIRLLEELNSSKQIVTLERSAFTDTFAFDRRFGASLTQIEKRHTLAFGVYAQNLTAENIFQSYAIGGRATYMAYQGSDSQVFTGASFRYRNQGGEEDLLRYRQRPVSDAADRILSTGFIADEDLFLGVEFAALKNGFWIMGEFGFIKADCPVCVSGDPTFKGGYGEVGYIVGGRRVIKGEKFVQSTIDRPLGQGGLGSLYFVGRFDTIDLNDNGVSGGSYNSITLGTEWSPTVDTRFGINFFRVDANLGTLLSGIDEVIAAAIATTEDVRGVIVRAQIWF